MADQPDVRLPIVPHHGPRGDAPLDVHQLAGWAGGQPVHGETGALVNGSHLSVVVSYEYRDHAVGVLSSDRLKRGPHVGKRDRAEHRPGRALTGLDKGVRPIPELEKHVEQVLHAGERHEVLALFALWERQAHGSDAAAAATAAAAHGGGVRRPLPVHARVVLWCPCQVCLECVIELVLPRVHELLLFQLCQPFCL